MIIHGIFNEWNDQIQKKRYAAYCLDYFKKVSQISADIGFQGTSHTFKENEEYLVTFHICKHEIYVRLRYISSRDKTYYLVAVPATSCACPWNYVTCNFTICYATLLTRYYGKSIKIDLLIYNTILVISYIRLIKTRNSFRSYMIIARRIIHKIVIFVCSFIHSFIHLFIQTFIYSPIHSHIHSSTYSFDTFIHLFRSPTDFTSTH